MKSHLLLSSAIATVLASCGSNRASVQTKENPKIAQDIIRQEGSEIEPVLMEIVERTKAALSRARSETGHDAACSTDDLKVVRAAASCYSSRSSAALLELAKVSMDLGMHDMALEALGSLSQHPGGRQKLEKIIEDGRSNLPLAAKAVTICAPTCSDNEVRSWVALVKSIEHPSQELNALTLAVMIAGNIRQLRQSVDVAARTEDKVALVAEYASTGYWLLPSEFPSTVFVHDPLVVYARQAINVLSVEDPQGVVAAIDVVPCGDFSISPRTRQQVKDDAEARELERAAREKLSGCLAESARVMWATRHPKVPVGPK
ncbi:MAG: hypothetical protein U1F29_17335 [Planctomycetota bacterium]